MPKAEVGSTKHLNNQLKSKGLQRLRWYCQACEKQCRDANGFKCHVASESHVRQMLIVGENSQKFINDYSGQFQRDFLQLLRTSHGEKKINLNHFYNQYISNKEFGKFLGREGICRVEEGEKGLEVAWIDNSPEALRRQDAIRKKERQDKGDEEREQKLIAEQVVRAKRDAGTRSEQEDDQNARILQREEGEKIKLSFGAKPAAATPNQVPSPPISSDRSESVSPSAKVADSSTLDQNIGSNQSRTSTPLTMKMNTSKPKNVFGSASKKNALHSVKATHKIAPQKPISEAERIMKTEIERKRTRESSSLDGQAHKRMKA